MNTRQVLLERIEQIREDTKNFDRQTMRWRNREFEGQYFNEVDFESLDAISLVKAFETIMLFYYRQG